MLLVSNKLRKILLTLAISSLQIVYGTKQTISSSDTNPSTLLAQKFNNTINKFAPGFNKKNDDKNYINSSKNLLLSAARMIIIISSFIRINGYQS